MRILKTFFLIFAAGMTSAQAPDAKKMAKPFQAKDYPTGKFRISKQDYSFGDLTVRVINVKNLGYAMPPNFCSAWVEVLKGEQLVKRFYYGDIEPVGFSFGAFVPKQQPDSYFAVVKEGDYDGRMLLIDHEGKVADLPGGFYFVTADKKFLLSEHSSDTPGLTVFDLANHRVVFDPKDVPQIGSWYRDGQGYYFMEYENPGHAERLDLDEPRIVKINVTEGNRKRASKVTYDFDPRKKQDCLSTPQ